jgi:peptidyl-prolyl cis-trans isomerase SurA
MKRFILLPTVIFLMAALAAPSPAERELIDKIVAVVEDEAIFESDVAMLIAQMMVQQGRSSLTDAERKEIYDRILQEMISEKLVIAQAARLDVEIPFSAVEERVTQAIDENRRALGGEEAFIRQLEREGFTLESLKQLYRNQIRNRMLVDEVVRMEVDRGEIDIADAELRQFYEEKKADLPQRPAVAHLKTIFIGFDSSDQVQADTRAKIDDIYRRAMAGESFPDLAKSYSEDPSAPMGGDLGFVEPEDLADQNLAAAVAGLGLGEISEPIKTAHGYHIVQVTEKNPDTGEVRIRHILVRISAGDEDVQELYSQATSIREQLQQGASFGDMARKYSTDPNANEGGDLGWLKIADLPEFFRDVLSGMQPGDISQVLRESSGFRIVKLVDRESPRPYEYEEVKAELRRMYEGEKLEDIYKEYVEELRGKFNVVVYR